MPGRFWNSELEVNLRDSLQRAFQSVKDLFNVVILNDNLNVDIGLLIRVVVRCRAALPQC